MLVPNNGYFRFLISTAYNCLLHLKAHPRSSVYSLLCKLGLVLILDADLHKTVEFFGLNSLDLHALILKALSHFTSFFEVVKTILFGLLGVITNL